VKEILVKMDDKVYKELKDSCLINFMSGGDGTIRTEFAKFVVSSIEKGEKEITLVKPSTNKKKRR
jgi:hypothetical protein